MDIGCPAVMPLAAPIGSGLGIRNPYNLKIIMETVKVPIIVDAGVGTASDAALGHGIWCRCRADEHRHRRSQRPNHDGHSHALCRGCRDVWHIKPVAFPVNSTQPLVVQLKACSKELLGMVSPISLPRLYLLTDRHDSNSSATNSVNHPSSTLRAGVRLVQIREKDLDTPERCSI